MSQTPVYTYSRDSEFVTSSTTISGWGIDQTIPWLMGAGPPEPCYYASLIRNMCPDKNGLAEMLSSSYSWYGLNNTFNMRGLYMDWAAGNSDNDQGAFATGFKN